MTGNDSVSDALLHLESRELELTSELARVNAAIRALRPLVELTGPEEPAPHVNCRCALPLAGEADPEQVPAVDIPPVTAEPLDEADEQSDGVEDMLETFRMQPQAVRRRADSKAFDEAVMRQLLVKGGVAMFRELVERTPKKTSDRTTQAHESDVRNSLQRMKDRGQVGRTGQAWSVRRED